MTQFPTINSVTSGASTPDRLNDVNIDDFLKLMIAELQNQDPLNPLDNDELVAQIGQIRSVGATEKLTDTLDSVLLGQNISSATNLIGAEIDAISDDQQKVSGVVERVTVANGSPKLHLDLNPRARASDEKGAVEAGEYEYRVVWRDAKTGTLLGVDPLEGTEGNRLKLYDETQSVLLSNLPETTSTRQVFRREVGEEDFRLVGAISDNKKSTFLDTTASDDLSELVLSGTPQMMRSQRSFTVSLKNVGEIRPPERAATPTTPTTPEETEPPAPVDDPDAPDEETTENIPDGAL